MNGSEPIRWRKSSFSDHQGGNCVEVGGLPSFVAVRDSKNPGGHRLVFDRAVFLRFTREICTRQVARLAE